MHGVVEPSSSRPAQVWPNDCSGGPAGRGGARSSQACMLPAQQRAASSRRSESLVSSSLGAIAGGGNPAIALQNSFVASS